MTDKPKTKRRWLQFSLRTMFVVVTVFCVWLGIVVKQVRDRRVAVEMIQKSGGVVWYQHESATLDHSNPERRRFSEPPGPEWLRQFIGDEFFFRVHSVHQTRRGVVNDAYLEIFKLFTETLELDLMDANITDAGLEHLKGLTKLDRLFLPDKITDAGLVHLKGLTNLQFLSLNGEEITDAGMVYLKGMTKLERLDLDATKVTDAGLENLTGLTNLISLSVRFTQVTDEGVEKLRQALPNCKINF